MWSNPTKNIRGLESHHPASDESMRAISNNMTAYRNLYYYLEGTFDGCEVSHVSRASNEEANNLANIGSQCLPIPPGVFWVEIIERSIKSSKSSTLGEPSQHPATGSGLANHEQKV
jgi:hypothetical protein